MDSTLTIISLLNGSIGEITNDIKPFLNRDFKEGTDILLTHFVRLISEKHELAKYKQKVLIQAVDGNSLDEEWKNRISLFDKIIVYASQSKEILLSNGITKPIFVIPLYIKKTEIPDTTIPGKVVFYHESNQDYIRKGIDLIVEGFKKANLPDNAELVLKVAKDVEIESSHNIKVISEFLPEYELEKLWSSCNVYLGLSRMEGFCIPLLRFLKYNKRIVVLENKFAGYNDFLNPQQEGVYFIPTHRNFIVPYENRSLLFKKNDTSYVDVEIQKIAETIRKVYEDELNSQPIKRIVNAYSVEDYYNEIKKILIEQLNPF